MTVQSNSGPVASFALNRRRFLGLSGAVALGAALAGCGSDGGAAASGGGTTGSAAGGTGGGSPAGRTQVRYWYWADTPAMGDFFASRIDEFNQSQSSIQVIGEVQPNSGETQQKIVQAAAAGSGLPDATFSNFTVQQQFFEAEISEPVEPWFDDWSEKSDFDPDFIDSQRVREGQPLLYLPWGIAAEMQYYRTDLLADAGLQAPDTIEELIANAQALTKAPDQFGLGIRGADLWGFSWNFITYLMNMGVTIVDESGNTTLDSPEGIDAATRIIQLYWDGYVQPSALEDKLPQMISQFQAGIIAQWQASTNHKLLLGGENGEFLDVMAATLSPHGEGFDRKVTMATSGNTMFKSSKVKDEAWEFLTFLMKPEVQKEYSQLVNYLPARLSVAEDEVFTSDPYHQLTMDSQQYAAAYPYWHKNWVQMQTRTGPQNLQRAMQKDMTVPELMTSLADLMRDV